MIASAALIAYLAGLIACLHVLQSIRRHDRQQPPIEAWTHLQTLQKFHPPIVPAPPMPFELPDGTFDAVAYLAWLNSK